MNMPAGMSAESSSNNTENTEPAGSKEPGPLSSVQELRTDVAEWTVSLSGSLWWLAVSKHKDCLFNPIFTNSQSGIQCQLYTH